MLGNKIVSESVNDLSPHENTTANIHYTPEEAGTFFTNLKYHTFWNLDNTTAKLQSRIADDILNTLSKQTRNLSEALAPFEGLAPSETVLSPEYNEMLLRQRMKTANAVDAMNLYDFATNNTYIPNNIFAQLPDKQKEFYAGVQKELLKENQVLSIDQIRDYTLDRFNVDSEILEQKNQHWYNLPASIAGSIGGWFFGSPLSATAQIGAGIVTGASLMSLAELFEFVEGGTTLSSGLAGTGAVLSKFERSTVNQIFKHVGGVLGQASSNYLIQKTIANNRREELGLPKFTNDQLLKNSVSEFISGMIFANSLDLLIKGASFGSSKISSIVRGAVEKKHFDGRQGMEGISQETALKNAQKPNNVFINEPNESVIIEELTKPQERLTKTEFEEGIEELHNNIDTDKALNKEIFDFKEDPEIDPERKKDFLKKNSFKYPEHIENEAERLDRWNYVFQASDDNMQKVAIYNAIPHLTDSPIINNINMTMKRRLFNTITSTTALNAERIAIFFDEYKNNHAVLYESLLKLQESGEEFIKYALDETKNQYSEAQANKQLTKFYLKPYQSLLEQLQTTEANKNILAEKIEEFFEHNQTTVRKEGDTREQARIKREDRQSKPFITESRVLQEYKTNLINNVTAQKVTIRNDNPHSLQLKKMLDNAESKNNIILDNTDETEKENQINFKNVLDNTIKFEQARDHAIALGMSDKTPLTPFRYMQFVTKGLSSYTAVQNDLRARYGNFITSELNLINTPEELYHALTSQSELRIQLDNLYGLMRDEYNKQGTQYGTIENYVPQAWDAMTLSQESPEEIAKIFYDHLDIEKTSEAYFSKANEQARKRIAKQQRKLTKQDLKKRKILEKELKKTEKEFIKNFGDIKDNPVEVYNSQLSEAEKANQEVDNFNYRVQLARTSTQELENIENIENSISKLTELQNETLNDPIVSRETLETDETYETSIKNIAEERKKLLSKQKRQAKIELEKAKEKNKSIIKAKEEAGDTFQDLNEVLEVQDLPLQNNVKTNNLKGKAFIRLDTHNRILKGIQESVSNISKLSQTSKNLKKQINVLQKSQKKLAKLITKDANNTTIQNAINQLEESTEILNNEFQEAFKNSENVTKQGFKEVNKTFLDITNEQKNSLFKALEELKKEGSEFQKDFDKIEKKLSLKSVKKDKYIDEVLLNLENLDVKSPLSKKYKQIKTNILGDHKIYKNYFQSEIQEQRNNVITSLNSSKSVQKLQTKEVNDILNNLKKGTEKLTSKQQEQLINDALGKIDAIIETHNNTVSQIENQIKLDKTRNKTIVNDILKEEKSIVKNYSKLTEQKKELQNKLDSQRFRIVSTQPISRDGKITVENLADIIKQDIIDDPLTTHDYVRGDNTGLTTNATNQRVLYFKSIQDFDAVNRQYGRYPDLKELIHASVNNSIRKIAGLKTLKTSPTIFESEYNSRLNTIAGAFRKDLTAFEKIQNNFVLQNIRYINGQGYNKPITSMNLFTRFLPSVTSLSALGGASIPSLVGDSVYASLFASDAGLGFFRTMKNYFKSILSFRNITQKEAERLAVHIEDVAIDLNRRANDRQMTKTASILEKLSNKIYKLSGTLSGVNYITNHGNIVFNRMFLEGIANAETNPKMLDILKNNHGFTDQEIKVLKKNITINEVDNLPEINDDFKSSDLYIKLLNAMYTEQRKAISSASQSLKAITSADSQAGALQVILHNLMFLKRIPFQVFYDKMIEPLMTDKTASYKVKAVSQNIALGLLAGAFVHFFKTIALGRKPALDKKEFWTTAFKNSDIIPPFLFSLGDDRQRMDLILGGNAPYFRYIENMAKEASKQPYKRNFNKHTLKFLRSITPQRNNPLTAKLLDDLYFQQLQYMFNPEAYKTLEQVEKYRRQAGQENF